MGGGVGGCGEGGTTASWSSAQGLRILLSRAESSSLHHPSFPRSSQALSPSCSLWVFGPPEKELPHCVQARWVLHLDCSRVPQLQA